MSELEKLLQAIEQEVEDGNLPRGYLASVERVREEAAQQNAHLTPESLATSQAVVNASALEPSDSVPQSAQAQVA